MTTIECLDHKGNPPVGSLRPILDKVNKIVTDLDVSVVTEEDDSQAENAIESAKGDIEPTDANL